MKHGYTPYELLEEFSDYFMDKEIPNQLKEIATKLDSLLNDNTKSKFKGIKISLLANQLENAFTHYKNENISSKTL